MNLEADGAEVIPGVVPSPQVAALIAALPANVAGMRNVMQRVSQVAQLAFSERILTLLEARGHRGMRPVRAIYFDKNPVKNWMVPWHQDVAIAVCERREVPGFDGWSIKDGVPHVEPPSAILERMVTVRVHLDECPVENGAVRVVPGSHRCGVLSRDEIAVWVSRPSVACPVPAGGIMLMKPLVLHASSPSAKPVHRRVIHLEYSAEELPGGLAWQGQASQVRSRLSH